MLAAKHYGVALEVNNSSVRSGWRKNYLQNIRTYVELCMKHRVNIYVGSDAHDPSQVGCYREAVRLLDEMGIDEELMLNNSEEKFRAFIHFGES